MQGWRYYNHAAISTCAPHEEADLSPVKNGEIWNIHGRCPLLVRWTSNFDSKIETNWWYVIKDEPFDISALKAKRRYEINKGIKHFNVSQIEPAEYAEKIYLVAKAAYDTYPKSYRPLITKEVFVENERRRTDGIMYGAFSADDGKLCGYAWIKKYNGYIDFVNLKADPFYEKNGVNAALIYAILKDNENFLSGGGYICDGARNVNHETSFQDYLERNFGFRKAYCNLHIKYRHIVRIIMNVLYPIRRVLFKIDNISLIHNINALIKMEEIIRSSKNKGIYHE